MCFSLSFFLKKSYLGYTKHLTGWLISRLIQEALATTKEPVVRAECKKDGEEEEEQVDVFEMEVDMRHIQYQGETLPPFPWFIRVSPGIR